MLCSLHSHRGHPSVPAGFLQSEKYHLPQPVISRTGGTAISLHPQPFTSFTGILDNILHIIINLFRESKIPPTYLSRKINVYVRALCQTQVPVHSPMITSDILLLRHGHHQGSIFSVQNRRPHNNCSAPFSYFRSP